MRILLADDNSEIRAALRLLLAEMDEDDIVEAADQAEVHAVVADSCIHLVLLDWELPDSTTGRARGKDDETGCARLVTELKRRPSDCRIVAMSGRPEARAASLSAGCDGFVNRNEPPDRLVAILHACQSAGTDAKEPIA